MRSEGSTLGNLNLVALGVSLMCEPRGVGFRLSSAARARFFTETLHSEDAARPSPPLLLTTLRRPHHHPRRQTAARIACILLLVYVRPYRTRLATQLVV